MPLKTAREIDVCNAVVDELNDIDTDLEYTAEFRWSFGFTESDMGELRVPVRPYDTGYETEATHEERNEYEIEIGFRKMVDRTDNDDISKHFNLLTAVADMYFIDRAIKVGAPKREVVVQEKRWFPMMQRSQDSGTSPGIMDGAMETTTPLIANLIVKIREVVETP